MRQTIKKNKTKLEVRDPKFSCLTMSNAAIKVT